MARQIGKMLNAREPKIVNGPEILDKYGSFFFWEECFYLIYVEF